MKDGKPNNNQQYWVNREIARIVDNEKTYYGVRRTVKDIYARNNDFILRELKKIYKRGIADSNYLRELETPAELGQFLKTVKNKGLYEMLPDNYKFRADRLTTLNRNIWVKVKEGAVAEYRLTSEAYRHGASRVYHNLTHELAIRGAKGAYGQIPYDRLERIMAIRMNGQDFSQAIWRNSEKLHDELTATLASGFQLGKTYEQMSAELTQRMNVEKYCADRIIQTEANYYANQAELEAYKEMGVEKYQYVAVLDDHTSDICEELHGKIFKIKDAKVGVNYPPMHPNCRSSTISVLPWEGDGYTGKWTARRKRGGSERYKWQGYDPAKTPMVVRDIISPIATLTPQTAFSFGKGLGQNVVPATRKEYSEAIVQDLAEYPQISGILNSVKGSPKVWGAGTEDGGIYHGGEKTYVTVKKLAKGNARIAMTNPSDMGISFMKVKDTKALRKALASEHAEGMLAVGEVKGIAHHEFGHAVGHYLEAKMAGLTSHQIRRIKQLAIGGGRIMSHGTALNLQNSFAILKTARTKTLAEQMIIEKVLKMAGEGVKVYEQNGIKAISKYGLGSWHESFAELFAYSQTNPSTDLAKVFKRELIKGLS